MANPSVFISYARADERIAHRICEVLEEDGISCWIAPRNVPPGMDYGQAIIDGIKGSRLVLVLLSEDSGASRYVLREVERAVSHQVPLLPVRLMRMDMPASLEFFLGSCQWFDLFPDPAEQHLEKLSAAVSRLLSTGGEAWRVPEKRPPAKPRPRRWWPAVVITGLVLAALAAGVVQWRSRFGTGMDEREQAGRSQVVPTAPADGLSCLGSTQLEWSEEGLDMAKLDGFEVEITQPGTAPSISRIGIRYSYPLQQISGEVAWRVRAVYKNGGTGEWSRIRRLVRDQDSLARILRTRELHFGHAESGNNFINGESANLSGFDVDLARELVTRILRRRDPGATLKFVPHPSRWARTGSDGKPEYFLNLLRRDESVDLLASGISITDERKRAGLAFTAPVLSYPQTLITLKDQPGFVAGKPVFLRLGAVDGTTNMVLARQLQKVSPDLEVLSYTGSGAHEKMLKALFETREIEGCLVDKPLAIRKIKSFQGDDTDTEYNTLDITELDGKPLTPEQIGFVIRPGDAALREALNREILETRELRRDLAKKYFPMLDPDTDVP